MTANDHAYFVLMLHNNLIILSIIFFEHLPLWQVAVGSNPAAPIQHPFDRFCFIKCVMILPQTLPTSCTFEIAY